MTVNKSTLLVFLLSVGLLTMGITSPALSQSETTPETLIQNQVDALLTILDDTELTQPENREELKSQLINEFEPLFVFREMTQRALGANARSLSDQQVDELTTVFKNLLEEIYVSRLTSHLSTEGDTAEIESIEITGTDRQGPYARVNSTATFRKGENRTTFKLNYKMVNRDNGWKIYDVEIEGVSLISNYRSQFSNILTNHSYETLLSRLKEKLEQQRQQKHDPSADTTSPAPQLTEPTQ